MALTVTCEHCGAKFTLNDAGEVGKHAACPECNRSLSIGPPGERKTNRVEQRRTMPCPRCEAAVPRTAAACPDCKLSFKEGTCPACGQKSGDCFCELRPVVWAKETKRGLCTQCGGAIPEADSIFAPRFTPTHLLLEASRGLCVRCAVDHDRGEQEEEVLPEKSVDPFLCALEDASGFKEERRRKKSHDKARIRWLRDCIADLNVEATWTQLSGFGSFFSGMVAGPLGQVIAAQGWADNKSKQYALSYKVGRLTSLQRRLHQMTDYRYATQSEKTRDAMRRICSQTLFWGLLGSMGFIVVGMLALIVIIFLIATGVI